MLNLYLVGGAVRDQFLGTYTKDLDYIIETRSYDEAREFITNSIGCEIVQERPEYQVFRAVSPSMGGLDFALPRGDFNQDGRQSETIVVNSIEEDLARRDFTINAMAVPCLFMNGVITPDWKKIIDPFGGLDDLRSKLIRFVGEPEDRIAEDNLRVLRALRFAITKGMKLEGFTFLAITHTIVNDLVSPERIFEELNRMFKVSNTRTIKLLEETNQLYLLNKIVITAST